MTLNIPSKEELQNQIEEWNSNFTIGTKVEVENYEEQKVTKTEARILFDQKAVIYLEGHNGYFELEEVKPL